MSEKTSPQDPKTKFVKVPLSRRRFEARFAAIQAIYQMDVSATGIYEIISEYEAFRFGKIVDGISYQNVDVVWFRKLTAGVVEQQCKIDPLLNHVLPEQWALSRLAITLRAILRAGTWELLYEPHLDAPIIISQYLELTKMFFEDDEPKTVNAILDILAKRIRS